MNRPDRNAAGSIARTPLARILAQGSPLFYWWPNLVNTRKTLHTFYRAANWVTRRRNGQVLNCVAVMRRRFGAMQVQTCFVRVENIGVRRMTCVLSFEGICLQFK